MQATLSELHRETRKVMRPVIHGGQEVILTEFGKPVAKIVPFIETKVFDDADAMRQGELADESILESIREVREVEL